MLSIYLILLDLYKTLDLKRSHNQALSDEYFYDIKTVWFMLFILVTKVEKNQYIYTLINYLKFRMSEIQSNQSYNLIIFQLMRNIFN